MKILFYISKNYSIPIIKPLVKTLAATSHHHAFYLSKKLEKVFPPGWDKSKILNNIKESKTFNPDFVFCPGNFVDFRIPGTKIQLFHGLGVEKPSHYKIRHFFDVYCTSGPVVTKKFLEMKKYYKYFSVVETGWPKVDHILNYNTENLKDRFNIPPDKKVILFAPTHSSKMQSAEALLPTISQIKKEDELWLLKFHELMDKDLVAKAKQTAEFRVIEDYDITPYLHVADILISDTSSVIYEFMLLDKPIITYKTLYREDKGINITQPAELKAAIERSLAYPQEFSDNREKHLQQVNPRRDGKISENLIKIMEKIELPKKKKPLNLFRKFQVIYHHKFKKGYLK
ncbi:MAG: CDP-glycerol glycerophosphotransferase family protein [Candidatus Cloacimonadota bacterium]|nr:CDP-glycerol glycerophosphotransferase family protein [Candidatus Cloacimonadota bacterium]